ncbi:hypothetical protein IJZ97_00970 [bacterium]|nr:hypothetical protein [bacterium]
MILPISNFNNKLNFTSSNQTGEKKLKYDKDTLLENNFINRTRIACDKFMNAVTLYPAKGFKGDKNANFYEFLTMGTVPYLAGSAMMMAVFNSANKHFKAFASSKASSVGRKMALGVLFYGVLKEIAKPLVTKPVKWLTGVDTEVPYAKVNYELPDNVYDTDIASIEYHKVFESKEFPRWDLLYKSEAKGENRNEYFDKIAKKLGYGKDLKDSDQEMKPVIKEIAVKTDLAKTISSYLWAATGVMLAFQNPWEDYLNVATLKFWKFDKFKNSLKVLGRSVVDSAKEFYRGPKGAKGFEKYAGKAMLGIAALSTVAGVINAVHVKKPSSNNNIIDNDRKYVVN